jgi:hypothetical protein
MPKSDYLNANDDLFAAQTHTFQLNIGSYATLLGITPTQVTSQAADSDYFAYLLACQQGMQNGAQQWTAWKNLTRGGGTPPATGAPVLPTFPTAVSAVPLGIEARFRALVKQIKAHASYNSSIGQALGIEGPEQTGPDLTTLQPIIDAGINGNRVEIDWGWGGHSAFLDMIRLDVDRGDGKGFIFLANDTTPGYTDTNPFPATPTKWTYRAIYIVGDVQVGLWSNPVSVTVGA